MLAALHTQYDKDNIKLKISEIAKPKISSQQVLIKVKAAGVNPVDNMISRGEVKLIIPYQLPQVAGNELVGTIEKVGEQVTRFKVGDRVFARLPIEAIGAFAEYIAVDEVALAQVPEYLTDVEAAAIPLTALTTMQALEFMNIQPGQTIFISGGTGSVGAMAIPIAKAKGLTVITNGNSNNAKSVLALGANRFIDYKTEDYTQTLNNVDYVLDTLGGVETKRQMMIMKQGGQLVSLRAMPNGEFAKRMNLPKWKQVLFKIAGHKFDSMAAKRKVGYHFVYVTSNGAQLQKAADILEASKIRPCIDMVYPFERVNDALAKVDSGHSHGKTVLKF